VLAFPGQNAVNLAVSSGRATWEWPTRRSPTTDQAVNGAFKSVGKEYEAAPYGLAIPKQWPDPTDSSLLEALDRRRHIYQDLTKWGLQSVR